MRSGDKVQRISALQAGGVDDVMNYSTGVETQVHVRVSRHTGPETSSHRRGQTGAGRVPLRWTPLRTGWVEACEGQNQSEHLQMIDGHRWTSCPP